MEKIRIQCVCGARLKAPASIRGTNFRCMHCGELLFVPEMDSSGSVIHARPPVDDVTMWVFHKCACGKTVRAPFEDAGKSASCPICHRGFTLPAPKGIDELSHQAASMVTHITHDTVEAVVIHPEISLDDVDMIDSDPGDRPPPGEVILKWMSLTCPCGKLVKYPATMAGKIGKCPKCHNALAMPWPKVAESKPAAPAPAPVVAPAAAARTAAPPELKGVSRAEMDMRRNAKYRALQRQSMNPVLLYLMDLKGAMLGSGGISGAVERHPLGLPGGLLAGVALVCGVIYYFYTAEPSVPVAPPTKVFMYDLATEQLFTGKSIDVPPIDSPSGQHIDGALAGVRAYVFACGGCSNPANHATLYLEKFEAESQAVWRKRMSKHEDSALPAFDAEAEPYATVGRLITRPEKIEWTDINSSQAQAILADRTKPCPDGSAREACNP